MKKKVFTLLTLFVLCVTGASATDYVLWNSTKDAKTTSGSWVFNSNSKEFTMTCGSEGYNTGSGDRSNHLKMNRNKTWTVTLPDGFKATSFTVEGCQNATTGVTSISEVNGADVSYSLPFSSAADASYTYIFPTPVTGSFTYTISGDKQILAKFIISDTPKTGVTVNDTQSDVAAYLDNTGSISGDPTTKSFTSPYFTLSGANIQSGSGSFTIDANAYTPFKIGQGSDTEYEIVPAKGATITAASLYVTSNNNDKACLINGTATAKKGKTPTKIDLVESAGKWKFTFEYSGSTYHNQALIVLKVTFNAPASIDMIVSNAGYATLFYDKNLVVPTGVTAYKASVNGLNIALTDIGALIPAGTGVILEAAQATYNFIATNTDASAVDVSGNILTGTISATTKAALGGTVYTLGQNGEGVVGLRNYTGTDIRAYSAYATSISSARDFYAFDEDVTAISKVETKKVENNVFFNLAGQQVAQPTKGLYIVNGKKVIIK